MSFYNQTALGIRYLENACRKAGIEARLLFFKRITYDNPQKCTEKELSLLKEYIDKTKPSVIGLSAMSSMCLETIKEVNSFIKSHYDVPVVWGGVYPTLFPKESLEHADIVIRGEGEETIVELCQALFDNQPYDDILNVAYKKNGEYIVNDVRPLCQDLDELGYPIISNENKAMIDGECIMYGDTRLHNTYYELAASRGCPFGCSYCGAVNIKRVYRGKGHFLRFRSVENVMQELRDAKAKIKELKEIRFWDEIFSDDENWVDDFVAQYKRDINLPFEIWCHPLKVDRKLISKLVDAGLFSAVMGIQSGSTRIRKDIFHRAESQEAIIEASRVFRDCKVPRVIYDFMLQHPFENNEDIKASYELCTKLAGKFQLQLHGLAFFPGTDIVDIAIKMNIFTKEELDRIMYGSYSEQYEMFHKYKTDNPTSNFWYQLIAMTQYPSLRPMAKMLAANPGARFNRSMASGFSKLPHNITRAKNKVKRGFAKIKRK